MLSDLTAFQGALTEIPLSSPLYPAAWKEFSSPPERLYALGDISLLKEQKFAVVGSRRTPANALKLGAEVCKALSEAFIILTGTADGGDSAAIEGALAGSGRVICLLAGGFSALPQANLSLLERVAKRGLLLSFQLFETSVRTFSYELRNKLLAKLSCGVLVLGAGEKSGALITAKYAMGYKLPVFAFPYPPNSSSGCGCNALIKQGGHLTEGAGDIAAAYGIELIERKKSLALSADEEKALSAIKELLTVHVTELAAKTGIPAFKLRGVLSALEVKGMITAIGGNRYALV